MNKLISSINKSLTDKLEYKEIISLSEKFNNLKNSEVNKINFKKKLKICIISDYTTAFLSKVLPIYLANQGINANLIEKEYGSFNFLLRDLNNRFWSENFDIFIIIPSSNNLSLPKLQDSKKKIKTCEKNDLLIWKKLWKKIKNKNVIQFTYDPPLISNYGLFDGIQTNGLLNYIRKINEKLNLYKPKNVKLVDVENVIGLYGNIGLKWPDQKIYNLTKQPFSFESIPSLCHIISILCSNIIGLSKKVLVIDLDNTIWGGVVGDLGYQKIVLGPESPEGEAYQNFQRYIKKLHEKGIIICVCSKNNENIAKETFKKNKNMILSLNDVTIFKANFNDKATNIKEISKSLNLGLDSIVFVDDSIFECEYIKKEIPDVLTIHLKDDASNFIEIIENISPFVFSNITKEDLKRNQNYKNIIKINQKINKSSNIDSFLNQLKSRAKLQNVSSINIDRAVQLLGKTNQFKLNQKLYNVKEIYKNKSLCIFYKDKFQDYGNIGLIIYKFKDKKLEILNWVMSCRVFSRRLEHFIFLEMIKIAKKKKCKCIGFEFEPTKRNIYLQDFLKEMGYIQSNITKKSVLTKDLLQIKFDKKPFIKKFN